MSYKHGQLIKYITYTGETIQLHSPPTRAVMNMTGWGYPAVNTHNISGPFQHGTSLLGYRFQPRNITLDIVKNNCSRTEWWEERTRLIDKLGLQTTNPNLPELGRLQWEYIENDQYKQRALDCYISRGLGYDPRPTWGILESLTFVAPDPIIYDPTQITTTIDTFNEELELPVTFPFILGARTATENVTYAGSWFEFPIIEVDGPTNGLYIENTTLDILIKLNYTVATGDTVVIDLRQGKRTVTNDNGDNLIQYVTADSNLSQFVLERDPIVTDGVNSFFVSLYDIDTTTEVRIKYYNRYVGI